MFIIVEGNDGAGKSTIVKYLCDKLRAVNVPALGATEMGKHIRKFLLNNQTNRHPNTNFTAMLFSNIEVIENAVRPLLAKGDIVVMDRSIASLFAYQVYASSHSVRELKHIEDTFFAMNSWLLSYCTPDLFLFCDVDIEVANKRLDERNGEVTHFDLSSDSIKKGRREGYKLYYDLYPFNKERIDCNQDLASVIKQVEKVVEPLLGQK